MYYFEQEQTEKGNESIKITWEPGAEEKVRQKGKKCIQKMVRTNIRNWKLVL